MSMHTHTYVCIYIYMDILRERHVHRVLVYVYASNFYFALVDDHLFFSFLPIPSCYCGLCYGGWISRRPKQLI